MSEIIRPDDVIQQALSPDWWSQPVSRRAFQAQLQAISQHLADLYTAADTAAILINFIMEERLAKTEEEKAALRTEVDEYVKKKKAQIEALKKAQSNSNE
jgi:hypothetical protein